MTPDEARLAEHVETMLNLLANQDSHLAEALAADPFAVLSELDDLRIERGEAEQYGQECSIAGYYLDLEDPPRIIVAASSSVRRQSFTSLHEFGHHLQRDSSALAAAVRAAAQPAQFEERACDLFASRVLIPDEVVAAVAAESGYSAEGIQALFEATGASRAACACRLIVNLPTHGFMAVLDREGAVTFATSRGDVFPPKRGSDQSAMPVVRRALASTRTGPFDEATNRVTYSNGSTSMELYGQAVWSNGFLIVVGVLDKPAWRAFAPARTNSRDFPEAQNCQECDEELPLGPTCQACGVPKCSSGHCLCTQELLVTCRACFLTKHREQFADPANPICADCS